MRRQFDVDIYVDILCNVILVTSFDVPFHVNFFYVSWCNVILCAVWCDILRDILTWHFTFRLIRRDVTSFYVPFDVDIMASFLCDVILMWGHFNVDIVVLM